MNKFYVLDACALIAVLVKEPGSEKVQNPLDQIFYRRVYTFSSPRNIAEVLYDQLRANAGLTADTLIKVISDLPLTIVQDMSDTFVAIAASFKVHYRISFADCFVLALAKLNGAKLFLPITTNSTPLKKAARLSLNGFDKILIVSLQPTTNHKQQTTNQI